MNVSNIVIAIRSRVLRTVLATTAALVLVIGAVPARADGGACWSNPDGVATGGVCLWGDSPCSWCADSLGNTAGNCTGTSGGWVVNAVCGDADFFD
jgi:hypothetical protein